MVTLYRELGLRIIKDMLPSAQAAKEYEDAIRGTRQKLEHLQGEFKRLKTCNNS